MGRCDGGVPNVIETPESIAASASEAATLLRPSPIYATRRPRSVPNRSAIVSRSATSLELIATLGRFADSEIPVPDGSSAAELRAFYASWRSELAA